MFWEEDRDENSPQVADDVVDLVYSIRCKCLPLDHAYSFSRAVCAALPWIETEALAGIHLIHGAESGNGWMRPEGDATALLHLSRRARMTLRVPKARIEAAQALTGKTLDVGGHPLTVGESKIKLFSTLSTQFSRYVVVPEGVDHGDEAAFMAAAVESLQALDIKVRKMLCGLTHVLQHPAGDLYTRSIMLADLEPAEAITLQQQGLGGYRTFGCGLFIPHKDIKAVHAAKADKKSP